MPPRLKHQSLANPIVIPHKHISAVGHGKVRHEREAASNNAHRITTGMCVDTEKSMPHETLSPSSQFTFRMPLKCTLRRLRARVRLHVGGPAMALAGRDGLRSTEAPR